MAILVGFSVVPSSQLGLSESPHAVKTSWLTFTMVHLLSFTLLTGNFLLLNQSYYMFVFFTITNNTSASQGAFQLRQLHQIFT